jgi:diguanylate cyclase (GGDEF)-like protein
VGERERQVVTKGVKATERRASTARGGVDTAWAMRAGNHDAGSFVQAVAKAFEKEPAGSLLLIDLDGFHDINVQAGRDAGDKVIRAVLAALKRWAETETWVLGRVGGDEFALYASGLTLEAAFLRAEKLRQELSAALTKAVPKGLRCGASIGVASAPRDAKTAGDLMKKADLALYAAKDQGGDTVALAPSDEMVLKSSYYTAPQLGRLKTLAERQKRKEAVLLREALDDLLRKHDR